MRGLVRKTILAAAIAGSGIFVAVGAQAHDDDHWRDERWRREHRHHSKSANAGATSRRGASSTSVPPWSTSVPRSSCSRRRS